MSGMWSRTLVYLGLREEPDEMYDEVADRIDDDAGAASDAPAPAGGADKTAPRAQARRPDPRSEPPRDDARDRPRAPASRPAREEADEDRSASNVRPLRGSSGTHVRAVPASPLVRAAVIELLIFDDVEAVGARYRTGQPVIFDVSGADRAAARRMVDFVAGLTFALRGQLTKVGTGAFLLTPEGVELPEGERQRLSGLGYRLPVSTDA